MVIEAKNNFVVLTAEEGKVFINKISGDILTERLYLGCNDSPDNYEEINEEDIYVLEEQLQSETLQTETEEAIGV